MALISCVNILTSFLVLIAFLPSQLEAYYTPNTGCHHNGTWYADKSLVPTTEKCLNCQCNKKTLVCRLKVCPEMPMPPPRGCVVVQKKNTCCPYLSCARLDAFYKIPATRRIIAYLDHYERESIDRVVNENMLQRRSDDTDVDLYVCVKNGTVYKSGSAMSSSNLCSYCYCIGGSEKCVKPKCMLPVEGCKPIFVDSTCCPVRYDCSTKQTGKSSQEVRYRKTSNKHYLRMSQRLQRNRGCTVGQQFYVEGQKMKSDKDKPCDICFCIRGQRKCAPKKCAPALRNCMPVVPKGQCCPSSYDCGSQRDYRRSQNSRQFNLFSLLFGKDEEHNENSATDISINYPHDRDPAMVKPVKQQQTGTAEKSIFDSIREGLEFIDSNNKQMVKDNENSLQETNYIRPSPTPIPLSMISMPEVSFLDLLLGPSESNNHQTEKSYENNESVEEEKATPTSTALNWVDLLLGPDEEDDLKESASTITDNVDKINTLNVQELADFESTTSAASVSLKYNKGNENTFGDLNAEDQEELITTTTEEPTTLEEQTTNEETTATYPTTLAETTEDIKTTQSTTKIATETTTKRSSTTSTATTTTTKVTTKTTAAPSTTTDVKTEGPYKANTITFPNKLKVSTNETNQKTDFLAQLLDGFSDILVGENKTLSSNQKLTDVQLPTPKPMPIFKPLPVDKTYTRINSKIANLTIKPPNNSTKDVTKTTFIPLPNENKESLSKTLSETTQKVDTIATETIASKQPEKATSHDVTTTFASTTSPTTTTNQTLITTTTTTVKPLVIKTNPTILDAEPLDENRSPTLPPSLPNLKIIPFLPTDAVKAEPGTSYDFYHHSAAPISRIDYDLYDDANLYPSITEKYPLYPDLEDGSKAEYIYKFNVEGPDSLVSSNAGKFDGTLGSPAFLKYDFAGASAPTSTKGFSPPTKTEGGFVPKEPLILDDDDHDNVSVKVGDSYHVTHHIIDITTPSPDVLNTTKVIEITTPDPFKDVIRTEPPPDLTTLIEDKLKNLINKSSITLTTNRQANEKNQNRTDFETHPKQTNTNPMSTKIETHTTIEMMATINTNNSSSYNSNNETANVEETSKTSIDQHKQSIADGIVEETNVDVNDVTTIPPFKTIPTAALMVKEQIIEGNTTSVSLETAVGPIKPKQTTANRPTTTIKVNRNKANATINQRIKHTQSPQKPLKIKNPQANISETKILASSATTTASTTTSMSTSSSLSTSSGSMSTMKSKTNNTRRIASTKPTKYSNKTATLTSINNANNNKTKIINQVKGATKTNVINIDRTSITTSKRTAKPTTNANTTFETKKKITTGVIPTATTPTTTTTIRTKNIQTSPPTPYLPIYQVKAETTTRPFFMSPFDKLPFMDASFEVKRNSATPSSTTTTDSANTSLQQHFAVQANIADANYGQDVDADSNMSSASTSRHKLMGFVHYKHTLNQLEGLEPSPTEQKRPQHSPLTATQFTQVSSPSSSSSTTSASSLSSSLNNLIDPTGILKLAGCNIYGRMYRVGRIILELSSPCLECKCTEIGVKCGPLVC